MRYEDATSKLRTPSAFHPRHLGLVLAEFRVSRRFWKGDIDSQSHNAPISIEMAIFGLTLDIGRYCEE